LSTHRISYLRLIKNNILNMLLRLCFQPSLWGQAFWFVFGDKKNAAYSEISFIAVRSLHQHKGVGRKLINYACDYLSKYERDRIEVKTEANNLHSNHFYLKNHFEKIYCENRFNRKFNVYLRLISNDVP